MLRSRKTPQKKFFPSAESKDLFFDWFTIIILIWLIIVNIYSLFDQQTFQSMIDFYETIFIQNTSTH